MTEADKKVEEQYVQPSRKARNRMYYLLKLAKRQLVSKPTNLRTKKTEDSKSKQKSIQSKSKTINRRIAKIARKKRQRRHRD